MRPPGCSGISDRRSKAASLADLLESRFCPPVLALDSRRRRRLRHWLQSVETPLPTRAAMTPDIDTTGWLRPPGAAVLLVARISPRLRSAAVAGWWHSP